MKKYAAENLHNKNMVAKLNGVLLAALSSMIIGRQAECYP